MVLAIILINVLVFIWELSLPPRSLQAAIYLFGMVPARLTRPEWAASIGLPPGGWSGWFTSMFLHGGFLHIAGNMWVLWIFGDNVEDRMGPFRFLTFYLACGLAAAGMHFVFNSHSEIPTVGASGAIAGVMGAYFLLYPAARVLTLIPIFFYPLFIEIPAIFFLGWWFLLQFLSGSWSHLAGAPGEPVAWWAHVGGFIAGLLLVKLFVSRRRSRPRPGPQYYGFTVRRR